MKHQNITYPDRTKMPSLGKLSPLNMPKPQKVILKNGMEAFLIEAGQEKITRIDVVFEAGSAFQSKRLVAGSVNSLLKEGTQTKSSNEIAGLLDYYGAYLNTSYNKDTASIMLLSLTKHLDVLLPLLGELISRSVFPERELEIYLNRQKQRYLVNIEKVKYRASLEFNKIIFGDDTAYGQVLEMDDFNHVTREDVVSFYQNFYVPDRAYMVVSGHIDKEVVNLLEQYLGAFERENTYDDLKSIRFFSEPSVFEKKIEKKNALQSALRIGKPIVNRTHPDFAMVSLLNTVLGGYFGSRLMSNLREDKGYTYGAYSYLQTYKRAAYFTVATEVNSSYTQAALNEICREVKRLREVPISKEELTLVKHYIYGNFQKSFDGPLALSDRFMAVKDHGLTFDHFKQVLEKIMEATPEKLLETANRYFQADRMVRLIVGKIDED